MRVATAMGVCCFVVFSRYAVVGARECGACGEPSRASERGATQDRGLCVARRQKKNGGEPSHIMFVASLRCLLLLFCAYGICGRADVDAVAILHQSARARERERERESEEQRSEARRARRRDSPSLWFVVSGRAARTVRVIFGAARTRRIPSGPYMSVWRACAMHQRAISMRMCGGSGCALSALAGSARRVL